MPRKIYILAPYPFGKAPSQRFRFEQYIERFEAEGNTIEFHPFLSDSTWQSLYKDGSFFKKALGILSSFWRRFLLLFTLRKADIIFIHREASMIGPPVFEWIIAKLLRKPYIYDFDDAIWLPNYSESNAKFHRLKSYWKIKYISKWAEHVSVGNAFLQEWAEKYNSNTTIIPTTIDLENVHTQKSDHAQAVPIIGWTGTHTTLHYIEEILPVLQELEKTHSFIFRVISNHPPEFELASLDYLPWNKATEITDLATFNIGVMPLNETPWSKGKCGFKALQYMALGIAPVISPVGVNTDIVSDGSNGFLCNTPEEWKTRLIELLTSPSLRQEIGEKAHQKIQSTYSVSANYSTYSKLLNA